MKHHFFFSNFHRDPGSESGGGSVDPSASAGAASAQPAGSADSTDGGQSTDGGLGSSPASSPAPVDAASLEARFNAGETLTDAEMEAYEAAIMAGNKPKEDDEPTQPEEPGDDEPAQGEEGGKATVTPELEAAMAEVGAKSVEELPVKVKALRAALSQQGQQVAQAKQVSQLLTDLAEGKPEAIAHFEKVSGRKFPVGVQVAQVQQAQAPTVDSSLLIPQEVIDSSLEPEVLKAINANIARVLQAQEAKLAPYIKQAEAATQAAEMERSRSRVTDDLVEVAGKYSDVYGAAGSSVRELVSQYVQTGNVDPRIQPLIETAQYMIQHQLPSLDAAHKILHFDKVRSSAVEREIAARRETVAKVTGAKPTVGLGGKATVGGEFTSADMDAIKAGRIEAPAEWFTAEGIPIPSKMPLVARKAYGV